MSEKIEATYGYLYNFAFVPRRKLLREFRQHKESIGKILTQMCGYLKVKVYWCLVADNHIQLLVELPKNLYRDNFLCRCKNSVQQSSKKDSMIYPVH